MTFAVTYIEVRPAAQREAIALIQTYRSAAQAAGGNTGFHTLQEIARPNRFVLLEGWSDDQFLRQHESAETAGNFRNSLRALNLSPYDRRIHQEFSVDGAKELAAGSFAAVTHVDVPPPRREETETLLRKLADDSRNDDGIVRYDIFQQNAPRTNHFTVVAVWRDEKDFASHQQLEHTREFRESLGPMLGAPYDERLFRVL